MSWSPSSWRERPIKQQPNYEDEEAVRHTAERLRSLPPLVFSGEVDTLRGKLADVERGRAFLLHGGDCAERFVDCDRAIIVRKLKILLQMSMVLTHAGRMPVVRVGRIGGQYAKPRSSDTEVVNGKEIASYRGDLVNDLEADEVKRRPDPDRMTQAYFHSATTLNFIRALIDGGFADLRHPEHWSLEFMGDAPRRKTFEEVAHRIHDSIDFVESLGGVRKGFLERVDFFTSHEGLLLPYEEAFTVQPPRKPRHYNLGTHFLWIGDRTRQLDGAHIEYFRGIANPIGVKVGPSCEPDELCRLIETLDPQNEPGRLTLISRYGAKQIEEFLPGHIRAAKKTGHHIVWAVDPMHGNGMKTSTGVKTRLFSDILFELEKAFEIHYAEGSRVGGVHFELTGDNVTECLGGAQNIGEADLHKSYETGCDPRLNYNQSLEMAFQIADVLKAHHQ